MDSFVDKTGGVAAKAGEFVDERTGDRESGSEVRERPLYGEGVPTAESYVDDMPLEWSRDETGAEPDPDGDPT